MTNKTLLNYKIIVNLIVLRECTGAINFLLLLFSLSSSNSVMNSVKPRSELIQRLSRAVQSCPELSRAVQSCPEQTEIPEHTDFVILTIQMKSDFLLKILLCWYTAMNLPDYLNLLLYGPYGDTGVNYSMNLMISPLTDYLI